MKRFYKDAATRADGGGFQVLLDGRGVKTPAGAALVLPTAALAEAIAGEWRAQSDVIVPHAMPLLRLANTAIDGIAPDPAATLAAIARFGDDDLLCYRAAEPVVLARRQAEGWDPLLAWAGETLGARLTVTDGAVHVAQPEQALAALAAALAGHDAFALAGLHVVASISGSLVLALAAAAGRIDAARAFALSRIDEDFQAERWGRDGEAQARADHLAAEVGHACALIALSRRGA